MNGYMSDLQFHPKKNFVNSSERGILGLDNSLKEEVLNSVQLKKQESRIKSHLLSPSQTPKMGTSTESWFPQRTPQNISPEKRHIDNQRERRSMQECVQSLYNRILLLEKEEREAWQSANDMKKETEKIKVSQAQHQSRNNLDKSVRASADLLASKKYADSSNFRQQLQQQLAQSISKSAAETKAKVEQMKVIQQMKKQQLYEFNVATNLANQQSFNTTRSFEKSALFKRILNTEQSRQSSLYFHNLKAQAEISTRKDKAEELERLQEAERKLLHRISERQDKLQLAISDMEEVVNVPTVHFEYIPSAKVKTQSTAIRGEAGATSNKQQTHISEDHRAKASDQQGRAVNPLRFQQFTFPQLGSNLDVGVTLSTARSLSYGKNNHFSTERFTTREDIMNSEYPETEEDTVSPINTKNHLHRKFNSISSLQQLDSGRQQYPPSSKLKHSCSTVTVGQDTSTFRLTSKMDHFKSVPLSQLISAVVSRPSSNLSTVSRRNKVHSGFSPANRMQED